jgi:mercuric ion transport protein
LKVKGLVQELFHLMIALAAVGLAAFTPYLDWILFPALAVLIVVTWVSCRRYARSINGT